MHVKQALPTSADPITQIGAPHEHRAPALKSASVSFSLAVTSERLLPELAAKKCCDLLINADRYESHCSPLRLFCHTGLLRGVAEKKAARLFSFMPQFSECGPLLSLRYGYRPADQPRAPRRLLCARRFWRAGCMR